MSNLRAKESVSLRSTIWQDMCAVARLKGRAMPTAAGVVDVLMIPGTWAVILYRLATFAHDHHLRPISRILYFANVVLFGTDLAPGSRVGPGLALPHPVFTGWGSGLTMGRDCICTGGVRFTTGASDDPRLDRQPVVGDGVVLLDGAKVVGPVTIGDNAVIAANALVLGDVEPGAVMVGQPARFIRYRWEPTKRFETTGVDDEADATGSRPAAGSESGARKGEDEAVVIDLNRADPMTRAIADLAAAVDD